MEWLRKVGQKAVGIPDRSNYVPPPEVHDTRIWQFTRHDHAAEKAGEHHDIRLADPRSGLTFNWASKKWPRPGQGTYAIPQPTHSYDYMSFEGTIPKGGYGAGKVRLGRHEPAELISSSPDRVEFNLYKGRTPEQFVLRRLDDSKWVINNVTPFRGGGPWSSLVPADKPKYREGSTDKINFANPKEVLQAKIDGAHSIMAMRAGKPMKVFSYRVAKSTPTKLIEHTQKIPGWDKNVVPKELDGTVLRGETYAVDEKGRALKEKDIGALLNTSTLASREKQRKKGYLRTAAFDVVKYKGKDVTKLPYAERLKILKEVASKVPGIHLPPMAETPEEKQELLKRVQEGEEPLTREGVVAWDLEKPRTTKVKFRPDYDVYVQGVVPSTRPGWAGGVQYSLTPRGPVVGTMGSGFTHSQRERMLRNPEDYIGRVARAKAHEQFDSGALRVPVFKGWHTEKSQEKMFKEGGVRKEGGATESGRRTEILNTKILARASAGNGQEYVIGGGEDSIFTHALRAPDGEILAYMSTQPVSGYKAMELTSNYVPPKHRRKGYSKKLLGFVRQAHPVPLVLTPDPFKDFSVPEKDLVKIYSKLGFSPISPQSKGMWMPTAERDPKKQPWAGPRGIFKESSVRERDGLFEVVSRDNRIIGKHPTREAARRQERAIHARRNRKLASLLGL